MRRAVDEVSESEVVTVGDTRGRGRGEGLRAPHTLMYPPVLREDTRRNQHGVLTKSDLLLVGGGGQEMLELLGCIQEPEVPLLQHLHVSYLSGDRTGGVEQQLVESEDRVWEVVLTLVGSIPPNQPQIHEVPGVILWLVIQHIQDRRGEVVYVTGEQEL